MARLKHTSSHRLAALRGLLLAGLLLVAGVPGAREVLSRGDAADPMDVFLYLPLLEREAPLRPSHNLDVLAATYLGGDGVDAVHGVDVAPDGSVVLGGALPGHTPGGVTPVELLGGGAGVVVRLDNRARTVRSVTRVGDSVDDLAVSAGGAIAVCGPFGVALLNSTAISVTWSATPGAGTRCDVGSDDTVAALVGGTVHVYGATGTALGQWDVGGTAQYDVAVDAARGQVVVTGYTQKSSDLQVAFVKAWDYAGALRWTAYDFSASAIFAEGLGADTRGRRVALGRDGKLYVAGTSNGGTGASIFSRDPHDVTQSLDGARYVTTDAYTTPYNVGSKTLTWYGRYDPIDGELERGQPLLTRLSSGKGNSIAPHAIMADEQGYVYLAGEAYASIAERDRRTVAGVPVGPYSGGEGFLLIVTPDLSERLIWTPFSGPEGAGGAPVVSVSARGGVAALGITLDEGALITHNALQPQPATLPDAYLVAWPAFGR